MFMLFEQLWHLLLIIYNLNVLIHLEDFRNSFETPVFLHAEIANQTAFIVS